MADDVRARNRAAMPITAALVDAFRAEFGPGVCVTYASEGGLTLGEPGPEGVVPVLALLVDPPRHTPRHTRRASHSSGSRTRQASQ